MNDRRAVLDLRVNVLRADQVGVWHELLNLALELDRSDAPLRSIRFGCFAYIDADGRPCVLTPPLIAQILGYPPALVTSTIATLLELELLTRDGDTLSIPDADVWFVPRHQDHRTRN